MENLFYCYIYPLYVKLFLNKSTYVVVQTEDIKQRFARRYKFPVDKIGVFFPEVEIIDEGFVKPYAFEEGTFNFIYPSMGAAYKEHITIVYAMERINRGNKDVAKRLKIHFTLQEKDNKELYRSICKLGLKEYFVFHGNISHEQVLSMIKASHALLFPSVIETLGLPLLEAASLGSPIIANDMEYAREVLNGYEGARYVAVHDYDNWAAKMELCCKKKERFSSYRVRDNDSWKRLINQIRNGDDISTGKKTICVLATASAKRGALMIYNQFVHALNKYAGEDEWHVFVDVNMPMPSSHQVYYHVHHTKGFGRLWFDLVGFNRGIKKMGIKPDVIFSLQNTGVLGGVI